MGVLWRSAFFVSALILSICTATLQSPVRRNFIDDMMIFRDTAIGIPDFSAGVAQQMIMLGYGIMEVMMGQKKPVTSIDEALASLASIPDPGNHDIVQTALKVLESGLSPGEILRTVNGLTDSHINSLFNDNDSEPPKSIYPRKSSWDAPYEKSEDELRSAIHMPLTFEYGANGKQPVLLVPGTGSPAGSTFYFNYAKLLAKSSFANPIWVNIPGNSLGDIQTTAEYVAYAMNYVSGVSNNTKIGVISFSQGSINVQWALKYWPSTRDVVEDFMPISADFHGTLLELLSAGFSPISTPAIKQQAYESEIIQTLRSENGDSAYVPTTSVYSGLDQIVEPQMGLGASAALRDAQGVGVTNTQVQLACPGKTAGGPYLHETMLVNPVAYALVVDALTHDGPGELSRIDLKSVCDQAVSPGLDLDDLLGTVVATAVLGTVNTLTYGNVSSVEPPLKEYTHVGG